MMKKRFILTTAGAAASGIGLGAMTTTASAGIVHFNHQLDIWGSEHSFQVYDSAGSLVYSMSSFSTDSVSYWYGSVSNFTYVTFSSPSGAWGSVDFDLNLANGTYTAVLVDSWSDGWAWGSFVGGLYVSGDVVSATGASFPSALTYSTSFSFTVIPAPSALALLGLAGLSARRRT